MSTVPSDMQHYATFFNDQYANLRPGDGGYWYKRKVGPDAGDEVLAPYGKSLADLPQWIRNKHQDKKRLGVPRRKLGQVQTGLAQGIGIARTFQSMGKDLERTLTEAATTVADTQKDLGGDGKQPKISQPIITYQRKCDVCFESFRPGAFLIMACCKTASSTKRLCRTCYDKVITGPSPKCPLCRKDFTTRPPGDSSWDRTTSFSCDCCDHDGDSQFDPLLICPGAHQGQCSMAIHRRCARPIINRSFQRNGHNVWCVNCAPDPLPQGDRIIQFEDDRNSSGSSTVSARAARLKVRKSSANLARKSSANLARKSIGKSIGKPKLVVSKLDRKRLLDMIPEQHGGEFIYLPLGGEIRSWQIKGFKYQYLFSNGRELWSKVKL